MENQSLDSEITANEILPNSTAILVLGITSIVGCFCAGIVGLVLGIIALALASKAQKIYKNAPNKYTASSYNNMKAGKVCAIVGVSLSSIYVVYFIIYIVILGTAFSTMPWAEMMRNMH